MIKTLAGRVVILTGAAGGLGRAYASQLADEGADLVLADMADDRGTDATLNELADELRGRGANVITYVGDVAESRTATAIVKRALDTFGQLHAVVNNAGNWYESSIVDSDIEWWDRLMNVHGRAPYLLMRAAGQYWRSAADAGLDLQPSVVNTTSRSALNSIETHGQYAAAKSAVIGLSIIAAKEFQQFGGRVNCIAPAARTNMLRQIPRMAQMLEAPIPDGQFDVWDPANVAGLVAYLTSASCSVNGRILFCSGGVIQEYDWTKPLSALSRDHRWTSQDLSLELPGHIARAAASTI